MHNLWIFMETNLMSKRVISIDEDNYKIIMECLSEIETRVQYYPDPFLRLPVMGNISVIKNALG